MQDVRIRLGSAAVLTLITFTSISGAIATFLWWLIFTPRFEILKGIRTTYPVFFLIAFFSMVLEITGGEGISYFVRMSVIVLIGMWLMSEQHQGELLNICVWLFGKRTGFEMGMMAEMGMQSFELLLADLDRIRIAGKLKGIGWSYRQLVPAGLVLIRGAIVRANDTAELLAVRGFSQGGTLCPVFETTPRDILMGISVAALGIIVFIPVSEFFILYR
jgi:energy-coupling factor transport system permease protein